MAGQVQGQTTDPEFRADIEKLFEVSGTGALGLQMSTMVSSQFLDAMKQVQPDVPERAVTIVRETLNAEFAKAFAPKGELMTRLADIYAASFTHAEVKALIVFYNSDVGRKAVSVLPRLAQEGAAAGQGWAQQNLPRILGALEQRLKSEQLLK
jgi:uncharacterized protein